MATQSDQYCNNTPRGQLRSLLDSVIEGGRKDVYIYSAGHLNSANLYKPPEEKHQPWKTSKKPTKSKTSPRKPTLPLKDLSKLETMKGTMVNFSLGTTGNIPLPPLKKDQSQPRPSLASALGSSPQSQSPRKSRPSSQASKKSTSTYSELDDGFLVEELKLPEYMLLKNQPPQRTKLSWDKSPDGQGDNHQFIMGHLEAVTKKDQFNRLKAFETNIIGKQHATERNVMSGSKVIEHLESKLIEGLMELDDDPSEPNFHRLQVYSGVFEDVIEESQTFGYMLRKIKREHDAYIADLLDEPTGMNTVLRDQVAQLSAHPSSNPALLAFEQNRLRTLEEEAGQALDENERLRQELRDEMERPLEPTPEPVAESDPKRESDQAMDIVETVESLKSNLLDKLDAVNALRATLRQDFVPSTVCSHLEQCIKETEIEIQRLTSTKNYFESNINEMEKDLTEAIESADTTERDQRRVWKRVSAVKAGGPNGNDTDSDIDQDESSKWDWYIS